MKFLFAFIIAAFAVGAQAQTAQADVKSASDSAASTANTLQNVGSPTLNSYAAPQLPQTTNIIRQHGLPVASAGPTYVSGAAEGACMEAGKGVAVQTGPLGVNVNGGADMSIPCDVRARATNAKVTGRSDTVVFMIQCQDPNTAMATEDAADMIDAANERSAILRGQPLADVKLEPRCPANYLPASYKKRDAQQVADGSSPAQRPVRVAPDQRDPYKVIRGVQ